MSPIHFLRPADRQSLLAWYGIRGMVNEDGTIEAHTEEDRQFVIRVHGMSLSHQRIQRELIDAHGDEGLRELVAELDVVRDPPHRTDAASIVTGTPSEMVRQSGGRNPSERPDLSESRPTVPACRLPILLGVVERFHVDGVLDVNDAARRTWHPRFAIACLPSTASLFERHHDL